MDINWIDILAIVGAVDIILGIIVKWTPVQWDNNIYSIVHGFIEKLVGKK